MRAFLARSAIEVAPELLGMELHVVGAGGVARAGRIVEVEAYGAADDEASHAHRGRTKRNGAMFGQPGTLYVYRIYGLHRCANVVCSPDGEASAVLIRAIEPLVGVDSMWADRPAAKRQQDLGNGPGKLTAALGLGDAHDGADLLVPGSTVTLRPATRPDVSPERIVRGPRIGISKAIERPWRFAIDGDQNVSRPVPRLRH